MKKKFLGRLLTMLLVAAMVFTLLPASAIAADWWGSADEYADDVSTQAATDETTDEFIRIFHLDCGRQYFSKSEIEHYIDVIAESNYTHLELALGNDALRFLLDDMSVGAYSSEEVTSKIKAANVKFRDFGTNELTESEMDDIIAYAKAKNISIIPLLNSPGHMDSILSAATALTGVDCSYSGSARTIDVTNTTAVEFAKTLLQKYIEYFGSKGCRYFNIGADEYANDKTNGFSSLISNRKYGSFISYVNALADIIDKNGMTPMMFNDGAYYNYTDSYGTLNTKIVICYWTSGWIGYSPASASYLANTKGHKIINTNDAWYYVLGRVSSGTYPYSNALSKSSSVKCTDIPGSNDSSAIGCMQCIWADDANVTNSNETARVETLIKTFSQANSDYFVKTTPAEPEITITPSTENPKLDSASGTASVTLDAGEVVTWTWDPTLVNLVSADSDISAYAATDASLEAQSVTVTPVAGAAGTATITASKDGKTAAFKVEVYDGNEPAYDKEIDVPLGGTIELSPAPTEDVTDKIDRSQLNASIATVTAEYKHFDGGTTYKLGNRQSMPTSQNGTTSGVISDDNGNYLCISSTGDITNTTDISKATVFTVTKTNKNGPTRYTIGTADGYYLSVNSYNYDLQTVKTASASGDSWRYSSSSGFYNYNYSSYYLTYSNREWTVSSSSTSTKGFLYARTGHMTDPVDKTVITITGKSVGTTYVTIDGTTYKINVSEKAPDGALTSNSINIEYWITNFEVYRNNDKSGHDETIKVTDNGATSDEGIDITNIVPGINTFAYSYFDREVKVYYWQAMRLDSGNKQTNGAGVDQTAAGTTLTHVRYHNNAWQYKTTDGTWHYFLATDQLVAYYLQKTEVTKEVDTFFKDWGFAPGDSSYDNTSGGKMALSVAVVYPDGTMSPSEDKLLSTTTIFNGNGNRDIGIVAPRTNEEYEISKITYTHSDGTVSGVTDSKWPDTATIDWKKKNVSEDSSEKWFDETVVWDDVTNAGTTPMANGKASNITWPAKSTAILVLIYLKPVYKDTDLKVVYYNRSQNEMILDMTIKMKYEASASVVPTFTTELKDSTGLIGSKKDWPSTDSTSKDYLPDDAYVTNSSGNDQTFNKQVALIPGVKDKYKSGVYRYDGAVISQDGKTLTLYYVIDDSKIDAKYVLDFGLPVKIPMSDFVENWQNLTDVTWNEADLTAGTLKYDSASKVITYTPTTTLPGTLAIYFTLKYQDGTTGRVKIGVIPASNVLYEENFLTQGSEQNSANVTRHAWSESKFDGAKVQQTQKQNEEQIFGKDTAYENIASAAGYWTVGGLETSADGTKSLTTSFFGNALDVIGSCGPNTGRVMITIKNDAGKAVQTVLVDTRYSVDNIDQVPLAHIELGDTDANYTAIIRGYARPSTSTQSASSSLRTYSYNSASYDALAADLAAMGLTMADVKVVNASEAAAKVASTQNAVQSYALNSTESTGATVTIDGFRVYRSADNEAYSSLSNEYKMTYKNILDVMDGKVITAYVDNNTVTNCKVSDYEAKGGPQNEIYLEKDQSIVFQIANVNSIQVSLRAVKGTAKWNGGEITSNTEMYYTLSSDGEGNFTIANSSENLLAIGNVKLPAGSSIVKTSELSNDTILASVRMALNAAPVDPEPEQPAVFAPHFSIRDYATRFFRSKLVTLRIDFSKDVSYVEIDGRKYTPNKLASWFGYYTVTFTDTIGRNDDYFYKVVFFDANGNPSETQIVYGK